MTEIKCVINDTKAGKSYQKVLAENPFLEKKAKETVQGEVLGLLGYELEITGATDNAGLPMRTDLTGRGRKRVLLSNGPCFNPKRKGVRKRKTVVANTITEQIAQINLKVTKYGTQTVEEALGIKKEEAPAEAAA